MRKILFCNIAWMKNYRGADKDDMPINGGKFVKENNRAHEEFNFDIVDFEDDSYCLGFVETKSTTGINRNQLHIEKIDKDNVDMDAEFVEDVLVIWCAKNDTNDFTSVVGWYKNATVDREYMSLEFDTGYVQDFNIFAKAEDCVLLPVSERCKRIRWYVPRTGKKNSPSYGFGQANVWFAENPENNVYLKNYLEKIFQQIDNYNGPNLLDNIKNAEFIEV